LAVCSATGYLKRLLTGKKSRGPMNFFQNMLTRDNKEAQSSHSNTSGSQAGGESRYRYSPRGELFSNRPAVGFYTHHSSWHVRVKVFLLLQIGWQGHLWLLPDAWQKSQHGGLLSCTGQLGLVCPWSDTVALGEKKALCQSAT
jgi:hypothetical protein